MIYYNDVYTWYTYIYECDDVDNPADDDDDDDTSIVMIMCWYDDEWIALKILSDNNDSTASDSYFSIS